MIKNFFSRTGRRPDYFLLALVCLLTVCGIVILASASSERGKILFNDSHYYLKHQVLYGLSLGMIGFFLALNISYQHLKKLALPLLLVNIGLLVMVFTPFGVVSGGATRWIQIGSLLFQPAELLKITFIVYLAAWASNKRMNRTHDFASGALPFFIICGIIAGLLILQPATSTVAILLMAGAIVYFVSGADLKHLVGFGAVGALVLGIVIWSTPYRWQRVMTFFNPNADSQGANYQINQALITIGSGQLFGVGYGQSTSKVNYLPAPLDDSIFAIAAQEFGFVGACLLVIFFGMLVFRLLMLARATRERFGHLILVGFASIIALQSLVNMGAISGIIPLTGIPLPFVSYGGTALAVFLTMMGIAGNISKHS